MSSVRYPAPRLRRIIMMRHAERMDEVDRCWVDNGFKTGAYKRCGLNTPLTAPLRAPTTSASRIDWTADTGLSIYGHTSAQLMGLRLSKLSVQVNQIYSSPAVRCVQTASRIIEAYKSVNCKFNAKIFIEYGLYEWGYGVGYLTPRFIPAEVLANGGVPVDCSYRTAVPHGTIMPLESFEDFSVRCCAVMKNIVDRLGSHGTALVVTHAPCFDAFNRYVERPIMKIQDFVKRAQSTPHLFMNVLEEISPSKWIHVKPPVLGFQYAENKQFSYEIYEKKFV